MTLAEASVADGCGGNFRYTEKGIKDCTNCRIPHSPGGYDYVLKNFGKISELAKKNRKKEENMGLEESLRQVSPLDEAAMDKARERQAQLAKPPGSLGCGKENMNKLYGISKL